MHGLCGVFAFEYLVGGGEARLDVTKNVLLVVSDVLACGDVIVATTLDPVLVQNGARLPPAPSITSDTLGKHLVLDINERQRLFRDMRVDGGDGGDGMSFVENLVLGEDVLADRNALTRNLRYRRHRREIG